MTSNDDDFLDEQVLEQARAAADAVAELCRETRWTPNVSPASVSDAVASLAELAAALPRAGAQLGKVLEKAEADQLLTMDSMSTEADVAMAVGLARVHLEGMRDPALELYRRLDAAHQATSHIISNRSIG